MAFVRQTGKAERYIDRETGETISRRQYDKRFGVLANEGFNSYEARDKAKKYTVDQYPKSKTVHHTYNLGLPVDLKKAIAFIIEHSPHFGTKMFTIVEIDEPFTRMRTRNGRTSKQTTTEFATHIVKKDVGMIDYMFSEISDEMDAYDIEYTIVGYRLVLVDRSE